MRLCLMGACIDNAVIDFKAVEKEYLKLNLIGEYSFDFNCDKDLETYNVIFSKNEIIKKLSLYLEESEFLSNTSKFMYDFYLEESSIFINELLKLVDLKESNFYNFIFSNISRYGKDNLFILNCFGDIKIFNGYSIINKKVWEIDSFLPLNEDGLFLLRALDNLDYLYGFKMYDIQIYWEDLKRYGVGECERLENIINLDSRKYVKDFENFLSVVVKRDDDEFFDDRYKRWLIILEHLKLGVKYVYSV